MKEITKLPKTFFVYVDDERGKGYVRFKSFVQNKETIKYTLTLTHKKSEASRYITLDNSKFKAKFIKDMYKFQSVQIIDEISKKTYIIR